MRSSNPILDRIEIVDFRMEFADELVLMWRDSFEHGVGIRDPDSVEAQTRYLLTKILPSHTVRVALLDEQIVGFVAASPESVNQLYVRRGFQGAGLGARLLEWAKAQSLGRLWLYTFARNERACAFYERHGFEIIARGFEAEYQLDDIKYEWIAARTT